MPREGHPHPFRSRDCQQTADPRDNLISELDLAADADLHVIDQQRHALWVAHVLKCSRYGQTMDVFHSPFPYRQIRRVRPSERRVALYEDAVERVVIDAVLGKQTRKARAVATFDCC